MTIQHIVAVYDQAVEAFMNPFVVPALGAATRSFMDEVNRTESPMFAHPEDYELWHLGEFDSDSGEVIPQEKRRLIRASDMIPTPGRVA